MSITSSSTKLSQFWWKFLELKDYNISKVKVVKNKAKDKIVFMYPKHTGTKVQYLSQNWTFDEKFHYDFFVLKTKLEF